MSENSDDGWTIFVPKERREVELDKKDLLIMQTLSENCRTTLPVMRRIVGLSKSSILNRIERLERIGVIRGYSTIVNIHRLGLRMFSVLISSNMTLNEKIEFGRSCEKIPSLNQVLTFQTGPWDLMLRLYAKDNRYLDHILTQITAKGKIADLEILELDDWFFLPINYLQVETHLDNHCTKSDTSFQHILRKRKPVLDPRHDIKDIRILGVLAKNPRISLSHLGEKAGMSADAVKDRIARLADQGIIGHFFANLDPYMLGLSGYVLFVQVFDRSRMKQMIEFLMRQPQMQGGVLKYTGAWNLQAFLVVKDVMDLRAFEENFISHFGGSIHKYLIAQLAEQTYYSLFPAEIQKVAEESISEHAPR